MRRFRSNEERIVNMIDRRRAKDAEDLHKPFTVRRKAPHEPHSSAIITKRWVNNGAFAGYESTAKVVESRDVGIDAIPHEVRKYFCIHGKPLVFRDTNSPLKCRRCP